MAAIQRSVVMRGLNSLMVAGAVVASALAFSANTANAVTLVNKNTSVVVDPVSGNPGHTISSWTVDGTNHNASTNYFYRIGPAGPVLNFDTLTFVSTTTSTTFANTRLITTYKDAANTFQIQTKYTITGGNNQTGNSDIAVQISVTLLDLTKNYDFNVYEVGDLDLTNSPGDDSVAVNVLDAKTVSQTDAQTTFLENGIMSTVTGPNTSPTNPTNFTVGTLASVNAQLTGNLNNVAAAGPGNTAYAYQFKMNLGGDPNGTASQVTVNLDRNLTSSAIGLVPEPATTMLALLGLGALGGTVLGRRSRRAAVTGLAVVAGISVLALSTSTTYAAAGEGRAITDGQSTLKFNLPGTTGGSATTTEPVGAYFLDRNAAPLVDHIQDLVQQWYWYKIGNGAGAAQRIDLLGINTNSGATPNGVDTAPGQLNAYYGNAQVQIQVTYDLTGSVNNSFKDSVARTVTVTNVSGSAINNFHLYSFTNLNLTQIDQGGGVYLKETNSSDDASQVGVKNSIRQTNISTTSGLVSDSLTTVAGAVAHYEIDSAATLKAKLESGAFTGGLSDTDTAASDPGYAFQYDMNLSSSGFNSQKQVSENLVITPEPASLALLGIGGLLIGMPRRRSAKRD